MPNVKTVPCIKLMNLRFSVILCLLALFFGNTTVFGQSAAISPYSSYGIGYLNNQIGVQGFSMGNTGNAMRNDSTSPFFVNLKNPASIFYNRITTFEAAIINDNVSLSTQGQTHNNSNGYFGYFEVVFPVGKYLGMSLGLTPMSSLGYDMVVSQNIDSISPVTGSPTTVGQVSNEYSASGGINRAFFGLAFAPFPKYLSIGINTSYLFGNLTSTQTMTYPPNYNAFNTQRTENSFVQNIYFSSGFLLTLPAYKTWQITIGGTWAWSQNINANYNLLTVNYLNNTGSVVNYDTIQDSNVNGKLRIPMMWGGGITIKKGQSWTFTGDYSVQNWGQYTFFGQPQTLTNATQYAFGMQYVPRKTAYSESYGQSIFYRLGYFHNASYLNVSNSQIEEQAITFGIGFPLGPNLAQMHNSILNIGVQLGEFGTTADNLLQEKYIKVMVGLTFNDRWFIKRQYE